MQYSVKALPVTGKMASFWRLLNDGTIEGQKPDGREIVASMKRAVMKEGRVEWHETCYCSPPLQHERSTVYDQFFESMEIAPKASASPIQGQHFWDYLRDYSKDQERSVGEAFVAGPVRYNPLRIL